MFGHQKDVITQDQKSDANVPLADSAIDALTSEGAELIIHVRPQRKYLISRRKA